jgi:hypothetical protein
VSWWWRRRRTSACPTSRLPSRALKENPCIQRCPTDVGLSGGLWACACNLSPSHFLPTLSSSLRPPLPTPFPGIISSCGCFCACDGFFFFPDFFSPLGGWFACSLLRSNMFSQESDVPCGPIFCEQLESFRHQSGRCCRSQVRSTVVGVCGHAINTTEEDVSCFLSFSLSLSWTLSLYISLLTSLSLSLS